MKQFAWSLALLALVLPGAATASPIIDPAGDFVPTYLGPHNGDLDVLSAEVLFTGTSFILHSVHAAPVGTTPGGFYVWGFNRGAGAQGFPTIAPGVLFDRVVVLRGDGTTNVAGGVVTINGNEITGVIPLSALLPSTGFSPSNYTWNLWPRSPAIPGNPNGNLSDFAPDNSNAPVTNVPEPASTAVMSAVVGLLVLGTRRARRAGSDVNA